MSEGNKKLSFAESSRPHLALRLQRLYKNAFSVGQLYGDDAETTRQRRMLLAIHYLMMTLGPLPNIVFFLATGLWWPALVLFTTCTIPSWLSFGLFYVVRSIELSTWLLSLMPLVSPVLVTVFAGGIRNSGCIAHFVLVSPLIHLCVKQKKLPALVLFVLAVIALVLHSAMESRNHDWIVREWGLSKDLSPEVQIWFWFMNVIFLQFLSIAFFLYWISVSASFLSQWDHLHDQMTTLSYKLLFLDLDDVEAPSKDATDMEKALFDVVLKVREWKPFIPGALFLADDAGNDEDEDEDDDDEGEDCRESRDAATRKGSSRDSASIGTADRPRHPSTATTATSGNNLPATERPREVSIVSSLSSAHKKSKSIIAAGHPNSSMPRKSVRVDVGAMPTFITPPAPPPVDHEQPHPSGEVTIMSTTSSQGPGQIKRLSDQIPSLNIRPPTFTPVSGDVVEPLNDNASAGLAGSFLAIPTESHHKKRRSTAAASGGSGGGSGGARSGSGLGLGMGSGSGMAPAKTPRANSGHHRKSIFQSFINQCPLQRRNMTYAIMRMGTSISISRDPLNEVYETMSTFFVAVSKQVLTEKGALHQFHGDDVVCIWSGANQQLRACNAVLDVKKASVASGIPVLAAVATGTMVVGTIGEAQRMPVVAGSSQFVAEHLLELCGLVSCSFLVESKVAKEIDHQFDTVPVEVVSFPESSSESESELIFEVLAKRESGNADEWMYTLASSMKETDATPKAYNTAFGHYAAGRLKEAQAAFLSIRSGGAATVLASSRSLTASPPLVPAPAPPGLTTPTAAAMSTVTTNAATPTVSLGLRESHVTRLLNIIQQHADGGIAVGGGGGYWRPVRKTAVPWEIR